MMSQIVTGKYASSADRGPGDSTVNRSWFVVIADAFRTSSGIVAVLIIVIQALWRGGAVAGGYFTQDDYLLLARAADEPMSLSHLAASLAGEFSPIGNLILWATTQAFGVSWGAVTVVVVVLQAAVALLMWVVLTQVLEDRWIKIPLLTVACFTPLTLGNTMWWGLATTYLPAMLLLLAGVSALLAHLRDDWGPGIGVAAAALSAVLFCSDRALLLPFIGFVAVAAMLRPAEMGVRRRLRWTAVTYAKVWLTVIVVLVARVLMAVGQGNTAFGLPDSFDEAFSAFQEYGRQGITGLVGGPWVGEVAGSVLVPAQTWPTTLAVFLCIGLMIPVFRALREPVVALSMGALAVYFLGGLGMMTAIQGSLGAPSAASRFVADAAVVVVLCLALALRKVLVPRPLKRVTAHGPGLAALLFAFALAISAGITTREALPALKNEDDRAFVDNLRTGLEADPRIVLLDAPTPEGIISSRFGDAAKVSTVAALLPQRPRFDLPSEYLRVADETGVLREVQLAPGRSSATVPDDSCGLAVTSEGAKTVLEQSVPEGRNLLELLYFTNGDTYASLETGDATVRIPVRTGAHQIQVPVTAGFDQVHMTLEKVGQTMCVSQMSAGTPLASPVEPTP